MDTTTRNEGAERMQYKSEHLMPRSHCREFRE